MRNALVGPERRFRLNASHGKRSACFHSVSTWFPSGPESGCLLIQAKTKRNRFVALILPSLPTHSLGKNSDYAAAVVCGSMHACSHLCVGMGSRWCARSQHKHLPHRTQPLEQQSGRRRRQSSRRSCEGNGSDVCSVVVHGMRWLLQRMSLCRVL